MLLEKKMNIENFLLYYVSYKQLNWYGPVQRMDEERLPGRRKKGRPRNSWIQEVTIGMRGKGINNMEWIDREEWRSKIKTLCRERCENIDSLYTNK